jgi:hypothetical protein
LIRRGMNSRRIAIIGISLAFFALMAGFLVWYDNKAGYRDAGALAELLAAVFGMVSVALIVTAILLQTRDLDLQREEIRLQRRSLDLQREEMHRLAVANEKQSKIHGERKVLEAKTQIVGRCFNYLSARDKQIKHAIYQGCMEIIWQDYSGFIDLFRFFKVVDVKYVKRPSTSVGKDEANYSVAVVTRSMWMRRNRVLLIERRKLYQQFINSGLLLPLVTIHAESIEAELKEWFENDLPSSIGRMELLTIDEIEVLISLCCWHNNQRGSQ